MSAPIHLAWRLQADCETRYRVLTPSLLRDIGVCYQAYLDFQRATIIILHGGCLKQIQTL